MQKDVIYIDVEDDITAIIGKVKAAKEKVVALVPPKRIGVLQSAVNLRLLMRAGEQSDKHVVLITNNQALLGLASNANIPVAKNLQSKPEVPEIAALAVDDDDDIIDGEQLPVGELAKTATPPASSGVPDSAIGGLDIDDDTPKKATPPTGATRPAKPRVKSGAKVPSFNAFRKKIFIFGGLGVLLIGFLIWAIWFAPHATVVIDAQTSDRALKSTVTVGPDLTTDVSQTTLKSITQQDKESSSVDFDATGTQDVGTKASGTVTFSTNSISKLGTSIPAGTQLTSPSGLAYTTTQSVTLTLNNYNGATAGITAADNGEQFNGLNGGIDGAPSGVSAQVTSATTGGTKKTIKIVLQADVVKATQQIDQQNSDALKTKLKSKFGSDDVVIDSSFTTSGGTPQSSPAIGQEASSGKAKLTRETTYTMTGIAKADLDAYLTDALKKTLTSADQQRVYSNGIKNAQLTDFSQGERTSTISISTTGQVGPKIDDAKIKDRVKGKRYGEIQADLKSIDGVNDADTKFSPFWVKTVPNDTNKIKIEFKLKNGDQN